MDREKFIQVSSTIRVLEKKLLSKQYMERLIEASNLDETLRYLSDSNYQTYINKLDRIEDYEEALKMENQRFFDELYSVSKDSLPIDLITLKYLYHNLKVLLKEKIQNEDYRDMYIEIGNIRIKTLREDLEKDNRSTSYEELYLICRQAIDIYEETKDPQDIDVFIDKKYFENLNELVEKSGIDLFKKYLLALIDFTNIKTILRLKKQGKDLNFLKKVIIDGGNISKKDYQGYLNKNIDSASPLFRSLDSAKYIARGIEEYEKTDSLSKFELEMDNYLTELVKESKKITYGPEVVFAYGYAKEIEIKNLRIILISKLNDLSPDFIRERLRETYV